MRIFATFVLLCVSIVCHAEVDENEIDKGKPDQGWFFYEKAPVKKPAKPKEEKKVEAPVPAKVEEKQDPEKKPMTVAWFKKMQPVLMEKAINNPTRENVLAYAYLVRSMGDKAQRFADIYSDLNKTDPFLDMGNGLPLNGAQRDQILGEAGQAKRAALSTIAKKSAGIMLFFDSKCSYCKTQISIVNNVAKRYKFDVMYVSVDGKGLPGATGWVKDNGHAKMLGIKIYPTTILAVPPKTYIPISFGLMAENQLEDTLLAASKADNLLPDDVLKKINPYDRGVLTAEDMQDGGYDDPDKFVEYVKHKLNDRY